MNPYLVSLILIIIIVLLVYFYIKYKIPFKSAAFGVNTQNSIENNKGKIDLTNFKLQKCEVNEDCENLACGRLNAADNAEKYCCPYGSGIGVDMYGGYDYCYNMPENSTCFSDSMCMDGYKCEKPSVEIPSEGSVGCFEAPNPRDDNCALYAEVTALTEVIGGLTKKGQCKPIIKKVGDVCDIHDLASAGQEKIDGCPFACGKATYDAKNSTCCESGRTSVDIFGDLYCDNLPLGTICDDSDSKQFSHVDPIFGEGNNQLCASGLCTGKTNLKYCTKKLNIGDHCSTNSECPNGCGRNGDSNSSLQCCEKGIKNILGYDYCIGNYLPGNSPCRSDDQCQSGNCSGNLNGITNGICTYPPPKLLDNNEMCNTSNECASNACGYSSNGNKLCCNIAPPYTLINVNGRDYCPNMVDGGQCFSDDMCMSKQCKNGACSSACGTGVCATGTQCIDQSGSGICCKNEQVCMSRDNVPMCCGDGSHCDSLNHLCIRNRPS